MTELDTEDRSSTVHIFVFLKLASISRPRHCVETLVEALQEVASIPAYLPNCLLLKDTVDQAKDWLQEAETLQV